VLHPLVLLLRHIEVGKIELSCVKPIFLGSSGLTEILAKALQESFAQGAVLSTRKIDLIKI
jgi:hypothetical protein